jgi:hypothetical protein
MNEVHYVRPTKLEELTGLTARAIEHFIADGEWTEGIHYHRAPNGRIFIDLRAYHRWVEGQREQPRHERHRRAPRQDPAHV